MPELRCGKKRIPRRAPIEIFDKFKPFFIKPLPFGFRFFAAVIFPFKHGPAQRNAVITAFRLFPSAVKFMQYALPNKNVLRMFVINTRSDFIKIPELNPCKIFCSEIRVCKRSIEFAAERKFPVQLRFPLLFLGKHLFHIGLVLAVKRFRACLRACFYHIESVLCPRNQLRGFLLCGGMFLRNGTVCFNPFRTAFLRRRNISSVELQNSFSFHFRPPFCFLNPLRLRTCSLSRVPEGTRYAADEYQTRMRRLRLLCLRPQSNRVRYSERSFRTCCKQVVLSVRC